MIFAFFFVIWPCFFSPAIGPSSFAVCPEREPRVPGVRCSLAARDSEQDSRDGPRQKETPGVGTPSLNSTPVIPDGEVFASGKVFSRATAVDVVAGRSNSGFPWNHRVSRGGCAAFHAKCSKSHVRPVLRMGVIACARLQNCRRISPLPVVLT